MMLETIGFRESSLVFLIVRRQISQNNLKMFHQCSIKIERCGN